MPVPLSVGASVTGSPTLVIQTAFLGDVVLTIPLLDALAERFGPVDVLATPGAAPLIETHPAVRQVVRYDKKGADRGFRRFRQLVDALRKEGYARAYLPHRSWRSAALAMLPGIPVRIGFDDSPARVTYTARRARPTGVHESVRLLALLDPPTPPPAVPPGAHGPGPRPGGGVAGRGRHRDPLRGARAGLDLGHQTLALLCRAGTEPRYCSGGGGGAR